MASCAVPECLNTRRNCEKSFFRLPKVKKQADAWLGRIRREDKLPVDVVVCEDHFAEECFDKSTDMRISLMCKHTEGTCSHFNFVPNPYSSSYIIYIVCSFQDPSANACKKKERKLPRKLLPGSVPSIFPKRRTAEFFRKSSVLSKLEQKRVRVLLFNMPLKIIYFKNITFHPMDGNENSTLFPYFTFI